jgi:hypothetical protein
MDATPQAPAEQSSKYLNAAVAITVALLATFMGICKVKDDNIVQAMQQAQADKLDHWGYYQARNIRQEIAEATITQLELSRATQAPAATPATTSANTAAYDTAIAKYRKLAADQASKKEDMRLAALQDQKNYNALNFKDDQFDLSDALLAIAITLLAVTALTQLWALFWVALVPTTFGVLMGFAGLTGLPTHPDALIRLLS